MTTKKRPLDNVDATPSAESTDVDSPENREPEITKELPILKIDERPERKKKTPIRLRSV